MDNKEFKLLREFKYLMNPNLLLEDVTTQAMCIIQYIPSRGSRFQYEHDVDSPEYWEMASPFKYTRQLDGLVRKINALSRRLSAVESALEMQNELFDELEKQVPPEQHEKHNKMQNIWKSIVKFSAEKKVLLEKIKQLNTEYTKLLDEEPLASAYEKVIPGEEGKIGGTVVLSFLEHSLMKSAVHHGVDDEEKDSESGWSWLKRADDAKIDITKEIETGSTPELPEQFRDPRLFKSPPKMGKGPDAPTDVASLVAILKREIPEFKRYIMATPQQRELLEKSIHKAVEDGISTKDFIEYWKWKSDSNAMNTWSNEHSGRPIADELGYEPLGVAPYKAIYTLLAQNLNPSGRDVVREIGTQEKVRGKRSHKAKEEVKGERKRQQSESVMGYDVKLTVYLDVDYLFDENGKPSSPESASVDQISSFHKALIRIITDGPTWMDVSGGPRDGKYGHWVILGKIENLESSMAHSTLKWWKQQRFGDVGKTEQSNKQADFEEMEALYDSRQKDEAQNKAKNIWDSSIAEIANILTKLDNDGIIKVTNPRLVELATLGNIIRDHISSWKPVLKNLNPDKLDAIIAKALFKEEGLMDQLISSIRANPRNISGIAKHTENLYKEQYERYILECNLNAYKEQIGPADASIWRIIRDHDNISHEELIQMLPDNLKHAASNSITRMETHGFLLNHNGRYSTSEDAFEDVQVDEWR